MSKHLSRGRFNRRSRTILAISAAAILIAGPAFAADTIFPDGDTASNAPNISYGSGGGGTRACDTRGSAVPGSIRVSYNGAGTQHFAQGESLTVVFSTPTGVTVTPGVIPNVPSTWGASQADEFYIPFSTSVANSSAGGKVEVTVTGDTSGYAAGADEGSGKPQFQVQIDCPSAPVNTPPSVAFTTTLTTSNEGSAVGYAFTITDTDAGDSWTFAPGYPKCGTDGDAKDGTPSSLAISNSTQTGSFNCTWPDGPASKTVAVKVVDAASALSNEATVGATVNNVAPTVAQPAFGVTTVDCRTVVTLSGISFSDPGLIDNPWGVDINWGDGSAHTTYNATTQGAQSDQTHTYNAPGSYTATVTVTDKDGDSGHADSSNTLVVNQVYRTDFLPPFDDSTPSGLIVNQMKNGRTVPVKATIYDVCAQGYVTGPAAVTIGVKKVTSPTTPPASDAVEDYSDAGASSSNTNLFRWNADATSPTGGFWIYNLDSKGLALVTNSFYRIDIYVDSKQATKTDWAILQPVK